MDIKRSYLYFLSILIGASAMAAVLTGTKLLGPYFGTSLYVWAASMAVGLLGLMTGYFLGGVLSQKVGPNPRWMFIILVAAGAFLFMMPYTSQWIVQATIDIDLRWGALLSFLVFLFPPILLMGFASPMIIHLLTREKKEAGQTAGYVFGMTTLGSILINLLLAFLIIPDFGVSIPTMVLGSMLALFPAASLTNRGRPWWLAVFFGLLVYAAVHGPEEEHAMFYEKLYHSEGILGQIKVLTLPIEGDREEKLVRGLFVNNVLQTVVDPRDLSYDHFPYTSAIPRLVSEYPEGSRAMIVGMGGGTLVRRLDSLGFTVDIVEIDRRIQEIAVELFALDTAQRFITDNARHYLRQTDQQYDLIIYDLFKGADVSRHLLTTKAWREAARHLRPGGMAIINSYTNEQPVMREVNRAIVHTLQKADFTVSGFQFPDRYERNGLIFAAVPERAGPRDVDWSGRADSTVRLSRMTLPQGGALLTDDFSRPLLFARSAMELRKKTLSLLQERGRKW